MTGLASLSCHANYSWAVSNTDDRGSCSAILIFTSPSLLWKPLHMFTSYLISDPPFASVCTTWDVHNSIVQDYSLDNSWQSGLLYSLYITSALSHCTVPWESHDNQCRMLHVYGVLASQDQSCLHLLCICHYMRFLRACNKHFCYIVSQTPVFYFQAVNLNFEK